MKNVHDIKNELIEDLITWQDALSFLTSREKPWSTKEWKEKRDVLIKDYCESCGKKEGPFVLQHLEQPPKTSIIFSRIRHEYFEEYSNKYTFKYKKKIKYIDRESCPNCGSLNVRFLKTESIWKCYGKCKRRFENPVIIQDIDPIQKKDIQEKKKIFREEKYRAFEEKYKDIIGKEAVLESISYHEEYISLKNTSTFCKKCAFLWDIKGVKLCPNCKQRYCAVYMEMCSVCYQTQN
jgi:hypothetical protein